MKHILVPLDGSSLAERVLPYVREIAKIAKVDVTLLQVLDDRGQEAFIAEDAMVAHADGTHTEAPRRPPYDAEDAEYARIYMTDMVGDLRRDGIEAQSIIRVGQPAEIIVEMAGAAGTMIAMATHGYSGVRRLALGSVADKVVHLSEGPVFLVRGDVEVAAPRFHRLLVPLDDTPVAKQVLPCAIDFAEQAGAELLLLRAIQPFVDHYAELQPFGYAQPPDEQWLMEQRAEVKRDLLGHAELVRQRHAATRAMVCDGDPAEVIVEEAQRLCADVIIMATHGRSGLQRWAMGSVADTVLHHTCKPMVLVRAHHNHN